MNLYIIGATGLVGRKFIEILEHEDIDVEQIFLFSSKKSEGNKIKYKGGYLEVRSDLENIEPKNGVAVLCTPSSVSRKYVPLLLKKEITIIDCSTEFRKRKEVPLVAVGVNDNEILYNNLICNPNCVVLIIINILNILKNSYGLERVDVTSLQSVSGSGKRGLDDLLNHESNFYPYRIDKTCIPLIGEILENNFSTEEDKIRSEVRKILNDDTLKVNATCIRVPIEACHSISLSVELNMDVNVNELIETINKNHWCIHKDIPNGIEAKENNYIYFGRAKKDLDNPYIIHMYIVGDNLYRGAASNAFWILKKILKIKKLPKI